MNYIVSLLFRPKIPVICIRENITQGVYHSIKRQISRLYNLRAIAIVIDAEKGQPVQTQLLASTIKQLASEQKVPIYSFVETRCTGEPYSLVIISNKSYCLPSSIVGLYRNVDWFGVKDMLQENNIHTRSWFSFKNSVLAQILPFQSVDKQDIKARIRQIQKDIVAQVSSKDKASFLQQTVSSLKKSIQGPEECVIGVEAIQKGLVGGIGNFYTVLDRQFPTAKLKLIEHSTILKGYLGVGFALPFVMICLLLGFKTFLKYSTVLAFYLFFKSKTKGKQSGKQSKDSHQNKALESGY